MFNLCLLGFAATKVNEIFGFRAFASYMRNSLLPFESRLNRA
jgi:hypothetical protein